MKKQKVNFKLDCLKENTFFQHPSAHRVMMQKNEELWSHRLHGLTT